MDSIKENTTGFNLSFDYDAAEHLGTTDFNERKANRLSDLGDRFTWQESSQRLNSTITVRIQRLK